MIIPNSSDATHKAWLYRLLSEIADKEKLGDLLRFKGGTCAAMQGYLDRFSVDLDFDLLDSKKNSLCSKLLEEVFLSLDLSIKDQSSNVPQYFLRYPNKLKGRSVIKIDVTFPAPTTNEYEPIYFSDIAKTLQCQTVESMFSNKLVALIERYEKNGSIAGRDIFDINSFYQKGVVY